MLFSEKHWRRFKICFNHRNHNLLPQIQIDLLRTPHGVLCWLKIQPTTKSLLFSSPPFFLIILFLFLKNKICLRKWRDSNSRCLFRHTCFPSKRTRPLCDTSKYHYANKINLTQIENLSKFFRRDCLFFVLF